MQPNPVLAPTDSLFVPEFSTKPQVNWFLGPKSSSVPLSILHVRQQQNPPQSNIPNATQLPNTHLPHNFSPFLNPHVVQPPVISPLYLVNSQVPVIPLSIAPQVPTLKNTAKPRLLPPTQPLPCPTARKLPLNRNPDLNLWCFHQNSPTKVNQLTKTRAVYNNFKQTLTPSTANSAISHAISQTTAPQNASSNHAATCSNHVNPFSTATNIDPTFVTPIIPPNYGHRAPAPLCWGCPLHPTPQVPATKTQTLLRRWP